MIDSNDKKTAKGLYKSKIEASKKYDNEKVDHIRLRVPKGMKAQIQAQAKKKEKPMSSYILDLIYKDLGDQ